MGQVKIEMPLRLPGGQSFDGKLGILSLWMVLKARRRDELTEGVSVVGKEVFLGTPHGKREKKCAGEKRFHWVCWVETPGRPSWGILSRLLESLAVAGEGRAGDTNSSSLDKYV